MKRFVRFTTICTIKKTHKSLLLVKMQAKACNFTRSNTPPWAFFVFSKLYKWYQLAQNITYMTLSNVYDGAFCENYFGKSFHHKSFTRSYLL